MRDLENELRNSLLSSNLVEVRYALANIVYWWNVQSAYVMHRVNTFLENITDEQIQKAMHLFSNLSNNSLIDIKKLGLPQFSNMTFVSKLRMFLEPTRYVTLDRKLLKLKKCEAKTLFHEISEQKTYIPITVHNCEQYDNWCKSCMNTANNYFQDSGIIAVDVERGIFYLVDKGKLHTAANIVVCMS